MGRESSRGGGPSLSWERLIDPGQRKRAGDWTCFLSEHPLTPVTRHRSDADRNQRRILAALGLFGRSFLPGWEKILSMARSMETFPPTVRIPAGFEMGKTPVTNREYAAFLEAEGVAAPP